MNDYYKILQVNKDATQDKIKKSYRHLVKKFHPDVNPDNNYATEIFKQISEAYTILSDENKKSDYDKKMFGDNRTSHHTEGFRSTTNRAYQPDANLSEADFVNTANIFENYFGFNPKNKSSDMKTNDDKIKPMKTNEAFEAIFGKRKF